MSDESKSTRWRRENPEKWKKQREAYRDKRNKKRRDKYACMSDGDRDVYNQERRERRKRDPEAKAKSRKYQRLSVLRQCGMSLEQARDWYDSVEKVCELCGSTEKLGIDHDHDKKVIRGLLCRSCNLGIGHLKDDYVLLSNALDYLRRYDDSL